MTQNMIVKNCISGLQPVLEKQGAVAMARLLNDSTTKAHYFQQVALNAIANKPKLAECTRASLYLSIVHAAELGLPPDGRLGALIPYGREAQFQPMYQGLVELMYAHSPRVASIDAVIVYNNEAFEYSRGAQPILEHTPLPKSKRGEPMGCYVVVHMKEGADPVFHFMWEEEITAHGKRYSKAYNKQDSPWQDPLGRLAMWKKTVFKQMLPFLPKGDVDSSLHQAITSDDKVELGEAVDVGFEILEDEKFAEAAADTKRKRSRKVTAEKTDAAEGKDEPTPDKAPEKPAQEPELEADVPFGEPKPETTEEAPETELFDDIPKELQ